MPQEKVTAADVLGKMVGVFIVALLALLAFSFLIHRAWNGSVVELFSSPEMTFRQAICLVLLGWSCSTVVFGPLKKALS